MLPAQPRNLILRHLAQGHHRPRRRALCLVHELNRRAVSRCAGNHRSATLQTALRTSEYGRPALTPTLRLVRAVRVVRVVRVVYGRFCW